MVSLELNLRPGYGAGPFNLGASLWSVLALLQQPQHKTLHPQVDIKYDSTNPAASPVVLHLRPHIDLLFSPLQRLTLINIRRLRIPGHGLTITYNDKPVSSSNSIVGNAANVIFRRATVNAVFGPTYSGDVMRYPGIWFGFDEDGGVGVGISSPHSHGHPADDKNQEVRRIVITQRAPGGEDGGGGQDKDVLDEPSECPEMYGELRKALVKVDNNGTNVLQLTFHLPPGSTPEQEAPVEIRLGETTAQDLIADIGSPVRVHYKEDDRMKIHKAAPGREFEVDEASDESEGYFYNYFQYGIDFLLSGKTHTVQKIVLHSNVPGTYLFQRYKRCPWEVEISPRRSATDPNSPLSMHATLPPLLEVPESSAKGGKKGKKKGASKGASPEPNLIDIDNEGASWQPPEVGPSLTQEISVRTVSLFDKVDDIKAALSSNSSMSHVQATAAIPIRGTLAQGAPVNARASMSMRQMSQLALSTSPPTMVFDRSSEGPSTETTSSLIESTSQLMGFDGMVLEVSDLGDILSVLLF